MWVCESSWPGRGSWYSCIAPAPSFLSAINYTLSYGGKVCLSLPNCWCTLWLQCWIKRQLEFRVHIGDVSKLKISEQMCHNFVI